MKSSKIKPTDIYGLLDLAKEARKKGSKIAPCFEGDAGIGKSEICQDWVKKQQEINPNFGFRDLRLAYMEAPDLVGLPRINGDRTSHILPEFWPTEGEGLLLLEEPNRANSSVTNTLMQLLTDRKVHNYELPKGWIIAACINPEAGYDVNSMDGALKNRFSMYNVTYDGPTFVKYMKDNEWSPTIVGFVTSGAWMFKSLEDLGNEGHYISPRTFSKLNDAERCGVVNMGDLFYQVCTAELGKTVGREYYKFVKDVRPLLASDFVEDEKASLKRLKEIANPDKGYKGDLVTILIDNVIDNFEKTKEVNTELVCKIAKLIPKDQAYNLLLGCSQKSGKNLDHFLSKDPELAPAIKKALRG